MAPPPQAPTAPASRAALRIVPWLFAASGCAALVYQLVWFQQLALVIGASAVSVGLTLAAFMGGLCAGSLWLPRFVPAARPPLCVYAALEIGRAHV